jgi:hypothetical protein
VFVCGDAALVTCIMRREVSIEFAGITCGNAAYVWRCRVPDGGICVHWRRGKGCWGRGVGNHHLRRFERVYAYGLPLYGSGPKEVIKREDDEPSPTEVSL